MPEITGPNSRRANATAVIADVNYSVAPGVTLVKATLSGAANKTITLPPVAQSAGRFLSIILVSMAGSNDYIVADKGDDTLWSDLTLDQADDRVLLYCDGERWFQVSLASLIAS
jgi:hypothetical protein